MFFSLLSGVLSATNFVNQGPPKKYPLQNLYLFTDPKNLFNNYWQGALLVQQRFWCLIGRTIFVNQGPPLPERFTSKVTFIHHYWKLVLPYPAINGKEHFLSNHVVLYCPPGTRSHLEINHLKVKWLLDCSVTCHIPTSQGYTVKPVLSGHPWYKEKVTL